MGTQMNKILGFAVSAALVGLIGVHGVFALSSDSGLPSLEGSWNARIMEPGYDGLLEETSQFSIRFDDEGFVSTSPAGQMAHGTYKVRPGNVIELRGAEREVYSITRLGTEVLSIYREGGRKAIYLVRN